MSRKLILALAAAAFVAGSLASESADARGFGGGHFGGGFGRGGFTRISTGGHFGGGHLGGGRLGGGHFHHGGGRIVPILGPGGGGHHGGGRGNFPPRGPRHPFPPIFWHGHPHPHGHWVFRGGEWIVVDDFAVGAVAVGGMAAAPVSGSCTCLIKTYTPDGKVVFSDMCTKESASALVGTGTSDAEQAPTQPSSAQMTPAQATQMSKAVDYDGRTYADYLAANPEVAQAQAAAQAQAQATATQPAPQSQPAPETPKAN